jgi:acetylornithine/succinyldiaminopimelate/putrescine aminotransferase
MPYSAVYFNDELADLIGVGDHGSTWIANPFGAAVCTAALKVIVDEGLSKNSVVMGQLFEELVEPLKKKAIVKDIRGRGLFRCIEFNEGVTARDFAMEAHKNYDTLFRFHGQMIRLLPPLNIKSSQLQKVI